MWHTLQLDIPHRKKDRLFFLIIHRYGRILEDDIYTIKKSFLLPFTAVTTYVLLEDDIFTHYIKNTTTLTLFALNFLHSVVREFNNCTTQGKVTRKAIKEKQTQQFKIHNTILIAFMATTIQDTVTIDGDEPAYGQGQKKIQTKAHRRW